MWFEVDYRDWQAKATQTQDGWEVSISSRRGEIKRGYSFPDVADEQAALDRGQEKFREQFREAKDAEKPFP